MVFQSVSDEVPSLTYIYQDVGEVSRLKEQSEILHAPTMDLLNRAGLKRGSKVLDLGCGVGDVTFAIMDILSDSGYVLGVDGNAQRIAINQQQVLQTQRKTIRFQVGEAETSGQKCEDALRA